MREHRHRQPKASLVLETLDDRIVPSAVGMTPATHAAVAVHSSVHATATHHHTVHAKVHHKVVHHHHHAQFTLSPQPAFSATTANTGASISHAANGGTSNASPTSTTRLVLQSASPHVATTTASTSNSTTAAATAATTASPAPTSAASPTVTPAVVPSTSTNTTGTGTGTDIGDIKNGPLAKAGQDLATLYKDFTSQGSSATFTSSETALVVVQGTKVKIDAHSAIGDVNAYAATLTGLGMQVESIDATSGTVEGFLPIAQLPSAAQNAQTLSLSPVYHPTLN